MGKHIHTDKSGRVWEITKQELPKKRGVYRFWIAETADKKEEIKGDSLKEMYKILDEKFGTSDKIALSLSSKSKQMKLTIKTTPKSISISDDNGNSLTVLKTDSNISISSTIADLKVSRQMYSLQKEIKRIVQNPKDNRDNYRVRFDKLNKAMTEMDAHSFLSLMKRIQKNEELQQA